MIYRFKLYIFALILVIITSSTPGDAGEEESLSRAESREMVEEIEDNKSKTIMSIARPAKQKNAGIYVLGKFKTGPQGRPPKNRNRNQGNQTRKGGQKPRPNRFQVIQIHSNRRGNKVKVQKNRRQGNRRKNKKGSTKATTLAIAGPGGPAVVTFATQAPPAANTPLMPFVAFDPNFQSFREGDRVY